MGLTEVLWMLDEGQERGEKTSPSSLVSSGWKDTGGTRRCLVCLDEASQRVSKVPQSHRGDHDGVPSAADILHDTDKSSPRILAEDKCQNLPLDAQRFHPQCVIPRMLFRFSHSSLLILSQVGTAVEHGRSAISGLRTDPPDVLYGTTLPFLPAKLPTGCATFCQHASTPMRIMRFTRCETPWTAPNRVANSRRLGSGVSIAYRS